MRKSKVYPYLLILPAMAFLITFFVYPMINLCYLSLTDWNLIKVKKEFIGVQNYVNLFNDKEFIQVLVNTLIYTVIVVAIVMVSSLILAVWFNKNTRFDRFGQLAIFTPHIISLVSISMVWLWLMDPDTGLLNYILEFFGLPASSWLQSSKTALISLAIVASWQAIGYYTLIILSSLQSIPAEIYEAADLDNTGKFKRFFKITLPMISPQLFFLLIVMTIGTFKVFDTVRIMTGGGPNNATNMLVYYIYDYAFINMKMGYASAAGVVLLVISSITTLLYFKGLSKKVHYQ
jgi:sn-glycerol 3-phosphate transport system permease protein